MGNIGYYHKTSWQMASVWTDLVRGRSSPVKPGTYKTGRSCPEDVCVQVANEQSGVGKLLMLFQVN